MTGFGNSLEEITKELDDCENVMNALAVDGNKARNLLRAGKELMLEHPFTRESLGNVSKYHGLHCSLHQAIFLLNWLQLFLF